MYGGPAPVASRTATHRLSVASRGSTWSAMQPTTAIANETWLSSSTWKTWPRGSRPSARPSSRSRRFWSVSSRRASSSSRRRMPTGAVTRLTRRPFHESAIELIEIPKRSADRQELGRHPPGRRRDGPRLEQAARRYLRDRLRRQRLLAAGLQAEGERQARHRPGDEGLDLANCCATIATSSSITRTWSVTKRTSSRSPRKFDTASCRNASGRSSHS